MKYFRHSLKYFDMTTVKQPMNITGSLVNLQRGLEESLNKISSTTIYVKSISDNDSIGLDRLILSFKTSGEYNKFIDSLNLNLLDSNLDGSARDILTTLLKGSDKEIKINVKKVSQMIDQDIRVVLKRYYLEYKIIEDRRTRIELSVITKAIETIESIKIINLLLI